MFSFWFDENLLGKQRQRQRRQNNIRAFVRSKHARSKQLHVCTAFPAANPIFVNVTRTAVNGQIDCLR